MRFQTFRTMMVIVQTQHEICEVAERYFDDLLTMEGNERLLALFQGSEFKNTLFAMHSNKAPGSDGQNSSFLKRFWGLCGVDLFQYGVARLENGEFPCQIMATNVVIIL